ncbi:MAG: prepilin-type N-terminal cleavage/methylation domain-containing protein [Desulfobulbaceae bacterium]|nr:prepilin-type N-terminal cleavage/methylation domain-containing protein [Desulfobulbaceae bacterium]HIJ89229.1 prepilin-type N-terminal cleavage/methylation domain-containing protein [Deltaproteobacteria bacterium]
MRGEIRVGSAPQENSRFGRAHRGQQGITLLELLIAVVLLGMVSTMIYSVLNVGINFSARGGKHLERLAREKNLLSLLRRQVNGAWYDLRLGRVKISGGDGVLRIVTHQPLLHRTAGTVLAVYRVNEAEQTLYYLEKLDYFNAEYGEKYLPDFKEMEKMYAADRPVALAYEPEKSRVIITLGGEGFAFFPKSLPPGVTPILSGTAQ